MTRSSWRSAALLFAIMFAYALLETARDAVFLVELGADALAFAYIAIAVLAVVTMVAARRLGFARRPRRMLIGFLGAGALGTLALAAALASTPSAAFALYGWSGVLSTLVVPTFWVVAERSLGVVEAKHDLGRVAIGGGLGALAGAGVAFAVSRVLPAHHLVTAAGLAFAAAALAAAALAPSDHHGVEEAEPPDDAPAPRRLRGYVRLLLVLGLLATVALTLGDLMFKRVLAARLAPSDLASWLAAINVGLNVIGLVVQLAVVGPLLRRGVGTALTLLPALVLAGALGFALTGALAAVIVLKLADGGLRYSLHRVATEILYIPVPGAVRASAKPLIEAVAQRGGQAVASVIAIALAADTRALAFAVVACVVVWGISLAFTRAAYVDRFRTTLDAQDIHRDVRVPALDTASVEMLMSTLASPDEAEAGAALDLLAQRREGIPALVLYHPSPAVVRRALAALRGEVRPDVARVLEHLVAHGDPRVRAAAIAVAARRAASPEGDNGYAAAPEGLADGESDVRAATAIALHDGPHADAAREAITRLRDGSTTERVALARAVSYEPREAFRSLLVELTGRREPAVLREVLHAWEREPALADEEQLISLLACSHVRGEVRRVLVARAALDRLVAALDDARTPVAVRRHLPRTISRFTGPAAAAALAARLLREPDGTTEFKILRALGRLRSDHPLLTVAAAPIEQYVKRSIRDASRYRRLRSALAAAPPSPTLGLLVELLDEKHAHAVERVFRALGVLYPGAGLHSVHDAVASRDPRRAAAAREILDDALPAELRAPLVDELDTHEAEPRMSLDDALRMLLADPSDSLRCIAAHHIAQVRLVDLRDELVRLKPTTGSELVTTAFDQAIASFHA